MPFLLAVENSRLEGRVDDCDSLLLLSPSAICRPQPEVLLTRFGWFLWGVLLGFLSLTLWSRFDLIFFLIWGFTGLRHRAKLREDAHHCIFSELEMWLLRKIAS